MSQFVVRRTQNPQADLTRGWSAWNGQYEEHPFSLYAVDNALSCRDDVEFIEDAAEAAEFCCDELDVDVRRCPATGLYAVRHHAGLASYELSASDVDNAITEARDYVANFATGGCCAVNPISFHHVRDDIYVFECESLEAQMDS